MYEINLWVVDPRHEVERPSDALSSDNKFYLRFPNRGRRTFSCLSKRKYAKRRTPRRAQALLALLGFGPAPIHSTSLYCELGADSLSAPLRAFAQTLRCSKRALRGPGTTAPTTAEPVVGFLLQLQLLLPFVNHPQVHLIHRQDRAEGANELPCRNDRTC